MIRVRGGGSITQDNSPIFIVDGIQVENALSVISPQDIASIDVLKDASSTAIYGARGANGVVIITMKSGRSGKTRVSYNGSTGYREITKTLDVLNPYEFVTWQYERAKLGNDTTFGKSYGQGWDTLSVYKNAPFSFVIGGMAIYTFRLFMQLVDDWEPLRVQLGEIQMAADPAGPMHGPLDLPIALLIYIGRPLAALGGLITLLMLLSSGRYARQTCIAWLAYVVIISLALYFNDLHTVDAVKPGTNESYFDSKSILLRMIVPCGYAIVSILYLSLSKSVRTLFKT